MRAKHGLTSRISVSGLWAGRPERVGRFCEVVVGGWNPLTIFWQSAFPDPLFPSETPVKPGFPKDFKVVRTAGLGDSSHCFTPNIAGFARISTLTAANRPLPFRAVFWRSSDTQRNAAGEFIVPEGQTIPRAKDQHPPPKLTTAGHSYETL